MFAIGKCETWDVGSFLEMQHTRVVRLQLGCMMESPCSDPDGIDFWSIGPQVKPEGCTDTTTVVDDRYIYRCI